MNSGMFVCGLYGTPVGVYTGPANGGGACAGPAAGAAPAAPCIMNCGAGTIIIGTIWPPGPAGIIIIIIG